MTWYNFTPVDTLFFRGAEPMDMGESHASKLNFPPPYSTVAGAIRTMVLSQNNISIRDYISGKSSKEINDVIGNSDEKEKFKIIGPLFMVKEEVYVPAPFSWFSAKGADSEKSIIVKGKQITCSLVASSTELLWAEPKSKEMSSIGGKWIKLKDLLSDQNVVELLSSTDLYDAEPRTGIALETKYRGARQGHIYNFKHIRFKKDVSMVYGIDIKLPVADQGVLKLGAEQRFGFYKKIDSITLPSKESGLFMCLSVVEGNEEANKAVITTGKISYLGGWDLKKGFHKPMKGYYPAGTVFSKNINNLCIAI